MVFATDLSKEDGCKNLIDAAIDKYGRIDVLINNAGVGWEYGITNPGSMAAVHDTTQAWWDDVMAINMNSYFNCTRFTLQHMMKAGSGSIVNVASMGGVTGLYDGHTYTAAKGAILSFTRALAGSYAKDNIRANAICAGRILTDRILNNYGTADAPGLVADLQDAAGRVRDYPFWVGRPEDIANIALFLASDESRMITGATIPADGGRSAY